MENFYATTPSFYRFWFFAIINQKGIWLWFDFARVRAQLLCLSEKTSDLDMCPISKDN